MRKYRHRISQRATYEIVQITSIDEKYSVYVIFLDSEPVGRVERNDALKLTRDDVIGFIAWAKKRTEEYPTLVITDYRAEGPERN